MCKNTCIFVDKSIVCVSIIYSDKTLNVLQDSKLKYISVLMEDLNLIYDEQYIRKQLKEGNKLNKNFCENNNKFKELDKLFR